MITCHGDNYSIVRYFFFLSLKYKVISTLITWGICYLWYKQIVPQQQSSAVRGTMRCLKWNVRFANMKSVYNLLCIHFFVSQNRIDSIYMKWMQYRTVNKHLGYWMVLCVCTNRLGYIWKDVGILFCWSYVRVSHQQNVRVSRLYGIVVDLNSLNVRAPENRVVISGDTTKELEVQIQPSYADNVLVVGPRYQTNDIKCIWTTYLGKRVSGVCSMIISDYKTIVILVFKLLIICFFL